MTVTIILTLIMCALLFLMIWAATYFYPWERLLEFFPKDIEEKATQHKPPFKSAPVFAMQSSELSPSMMISPLPLSEDVGYQAPLNPSESNLNTCFFI